MTALKESVIGKSSSDQAQIAPPVQTYDTPVFHILGLANDAVSTIPETSDSTPVETTPGTNADTLSQSQNPNSWLPKPSTSFRVDKTYSRTVSHMLSKFPVLDGDETVGGDDDDEDENINFSPVKSPDR